MAAEIVQETTFDELYNEFSAAIEKRNIALNKFSSEISQMISVMDGIQKGALIEILHNNLKSRMVGDQMLNEVEKNLMKTGNLEKRERKLIGQFNQVLANLYLFPGYVLAVSTGISGLLSSDPRICGLLVFVILVVLCFLFALGFAVLFAHQQLERLLKKQKVLATDRKEQHQNFQRELRNLIEVRVGTDAAPSAGGAGGADVVEQMRSFEEVNHELLFQAFYYKKFLWLVSFCGVLYAVMLFVAGYCVLCDCKAISFTTIVDHWQWLTPYLLQDM